MAVRFHRWLAAAAAGAIIACSAVASSAGADNAGQLGAFGEYGFAPGQFVLPNIFGAEADGSVYVGDQPENYESLRIQKFAADGTLEGSVTIPTPNEEVFQGIAVDADRGRFYLLQDHEASDPVTGKAQAEEVLVFLTAPDASGKLVPPSPSEGPATLPVPEGDDSIDDPTELAVDPANGDLQILGTNRAGNPVLQRIETAGGGSLGPRYDAAQGELPGDVAMTIGPDGTTYVLRSESPKDEGEYLYTLPPDLGGRATEVPGFRAAPHPSDPRPVIVHGGSGVAGTGPQIALSADGRTLYLKQQLTEQPSPVMPGDFQILGYSLAGGTADSIYGGGSAELSCAIQTKTAALASAGENLVVLDQGSSELGPSPYATRVLEFGPGGSGCPAPSAAALPRTSAGEVVSVPPGTSVTLDGGSSELGEWGEAFESATWIVEGPDGKFEETVVGGLTLDHTFSALGDYTIRLSVKAKLNATAPGIEPTAYSAPPQKLTVAEGPVVARPSITGLAPAAGPAEGGNTVTIVGSGLEGAKSVKFGSAAAADVVSLDENTVTATAPPGTIGAAVDIAVTTGFGTSRTTAADKYTYGGSMPTGPTVTEVSPANGPAAGGNMVTITGTELDGATAVKFGATEATDFTAVGSTTVTARSPSGAPGTVVDVTVFTPAGPTAYGAADRYKYEALTQQLGVAKVGSGSGTVATSNRAGISCGGSCSATFPQAATVVLLATPAGGSTFGGWSGACSGQGPCVVAMTTARSVTASFEASGRASSGPGGGGASDKKQASKPSAKPAKCKAGTKLRKVGGKAKCVKKVPARKKHSKGKKTTRHERGGKHHSGAR